MKNISSKEYIIFLKKLYECLKEGKLKNPFSLKDLEIQNLRLTYEILIFLFYKEILIITDKGYKINLKLLKEYIEKLNKK
jgi:hypothetical protein